MIKDTTNDVNTFHFNSIQVQVQVKPAKHEQERKLFGRVGTEYREAAEKMSS